MDIGLYVDSLRDPQTGEVQVQWVYLKIGPSPAIPPVVKEEQCGPRFSSSQER